MPISIAPLAVHEGKQPKQFFHGPDQLDQEDDSMLCKTVVTRDRRYITQITCYEKGQKAQKTATVRLPTYGKQTGGSALASLFNFRGNSETNAAAASQLDSSSGESMGRTRNRLKQQLLTGTPHVQTTSSFPNT